VSVDGLGARAHEREEIKLAKDFGTIKVFEVTWPQEKPSRP
jgi:hypothetical protein